MRVETKIRNLTPETKLPSDIGPKSNIQPLSVWCMFPRKDAEGDHLCQGHQQSRFLSLRLSRRAV
jgi:hypothetical protein